MNYYLYSVCGCLMYRVSSGFPGNPILRIGHVDDFEKQETVSEPRIEQFTKDSWVVEGCGRHGAWEEE